MACSACSARKHVVAPAEKPQPVASSDYSQVSTKHARVRSGAGQFYSILVPLVKFRPPTGWGLWVKIGDHDHFVDGDTGKEVVEAIIEIYKTNGVDLHPRNVWFNANLTWLQKVSERHSYVRRRDLEALADD